MKHNTALSCTGRDANKRHIRILYLFYLNTKSFLSKILSKQAQKPKSISKDGSRFCDNFGLDPVKSRSRVLGLFWVV